MREIQNVTGHIVRRVEQAPAQLFVLPVMVPAQPVESRTNNTLKVIAIVCGVVLVLGILSLLARFDRVSYDPAPVSRVYTDCGWVKPVRDIDGRWMVPADRNRNGVVECGSDIEMGA